MQDEKTARIFHRYARLSNTARSNFWKTKTQEELYRRDILRLVNQQIRECSGALESYRQINPDGTETIDLGAFQEQVDRLTANVLQVSGRNISDNRVRAAYTKGVQATIREMIAAGLDESQPARKSMSSNTDNDARPLYPEEAAVIFSAEDYRAIDALYARNLAALKGITDEISKRIKLEIAEGLNAGESIPKLTQRIQNVSGFARSRARTIARTETINATVTGARTRYKEVGVKEVVFISAPEDGHVCEICRKYDGHQYRIDDLEHMPPIHPNCRCAIVPVIGSRKGKPPK